MTLSGGEQHPARAPVNWGAGLRGIAAAWMLASTGLWYHSTLPLLAAAVMIAFTLFVPLRIGHLLFSRAFAGLILRAAALVLVAFAVAYPASFIANSSQPAVAAIGSLIFIGLLLAFAAILFFAGKTATVRSLPSIVSAAQNLQAKAHGWVIQITAAMREA